MYVVEGGIFTDTEFKALETGTEEYYGPFEKYCDAFDAWSSHTWAKVDICCHRLRIFQETQLEDYSTEFIGRGSKVETLPAGDHLGVISDINYYKRVIANGLRIPIPRD